MSLLPQPPHLSAPEWRREPYRLLFPLGAALGVWGTAPWLLTALGMEGQFRTIFHSLVQFQSFLTCFALGFLFTFVPRRTGTRAPAAWEMTAALLLPVGIAVAAWVEWWAVSQILWLLLLGVLVAFVGVRLVNADVQKPPPGAFAWILVGLFSGLAGSLLLMRSWGGATSPLLHGLGMGLLTQGMFLGLVLGVGSLVLPNVLHGAAPQSPPKPLFGVGGALHGALALALLGTFFVEWFVSLQFGFALRAAIVVAVLGPMAGLWRAPRVPGLHRVMVWIAVWLLPIGYLVGAAFPVHRIAAEHVVFLGFGLMVFAVATHVVLSHSGRGELLGRRHWQVAAYGTLVVLAVVFRVLLSFDPRHFMLWLGAAAAAFVLAALVWMGWLTPRPGRPSTGSSPRAPA